MNRTLHFYVIQSMIAVINQPMTFNLKGLEYEIQVLYFTASHNQMSYRFIDQLMK